ncbi:hypothetical protein [Pseudohalocynthiibacter sp. F2068]|jgi:hypothetical protein|uniref:hypothetical protein n=1 Tax=Pseudohalocynthiibacter sp. F2068 TaxID=2926418 RepID=UPI001FF40BE3|nr:hypothetical protein [Pseudohalocynthiibacter sp. F2068]MCK0103323.1 hypothetical protein [Pseudohalocynthiibacter sp. F2068]
MGVFTSHPDISLVHIPVQTTPRPEFERPLRYLRTKLANPSVDRGSIHFDTSLRQKIPHIPARKRETAILAHGAKDNLRWKPMMFERATLRKGPPKLGMAAKLQSQAD